MKLYPVLKDATIKGIFDWLKYVVRARTDDVQEFNNLQNIFILGRKVGKIPTSSGNVDAEDKIGDFNADADYIYILINDSGAAWRRASLGSW